MAAMIALKAKQAMTAFLMARAKTSSWGGSGRDVFEFTEDGQQDKIQDFEDGRDLIDLSGFVNRFADLEIEEISDGVVGITHNEDVFIIKGFNKSAVTVDMFDESDFIFVEDQFL